LKKKIELKKKIAMSWIGNLNLLNGIDPSPGHGFIVIKLWYHTH